MGNGTFVTQPGAQAPSVKSPRPLRLRTDVPLLLIVLTLLVYGFLMLYSASGDYCIEVMGVKSTYLLERQFLWFILGSAVAVFIAAVDYHKWRKLVVVGILATLILLIAVLIINEIRLGAARSLQAGSFQPSELAKLMTIIYVSFWLSANKDRLTNVYLGLIPLGVILGLMGGFILLEPDLSATVTIFVLGGLLFFVAGGDIRQAIFTLLIAVVVGALVISVSDTGRQRMGEYLGGLQNIEESGYHVQRSLEAVVKGGWFGVGIGKANTKYTGLPFPPTDSIFAVVAEETGMLGSIVLVILFSLLLWRGIKIAQRAPDQLGSLLASGLTFWIVLEAFVNMGGMVGLLPFAGNVLPFMSSGGSSMLSTLAAIGLIMSVARHSSPAPETEWRGWSAVIDLRGRNRRRRVSRFSRSAIPRQES